MKTIPLTRGKKALVSDQDWPRVRKFKWCAYYNPKGRDIWYAVRCQRYGKGSKLKKQILMHRFILGNPSNDIDHKDRNGLNNQRSNLRPATKSQNNANRILSRVNTSGFKGVSRANTKTKRWRARLTLNRHEISLGTFKTKTAAAAAYWEGAQKTFGRFARAA